VVEFLLGVGLLRPLLQVSEIPESNSGLEKECYMNFVLFVPIGSISISSSSWTVAGPDGLLFSDKGTGLAYSIK
jgi:hypothetical protein